MQNTAIITDFPTMREALKAALARPEPKVKQLVTHDDYVKAFETLTQEEEL